VFTGKGLFLFSGRLGDGLKTQERVWGEVKRRERIRPWKISGKLKNRS